MKKILFLLITVFLFSITNVYANEIYNIDATIYLDEKGNAEITEIWDVKGTDGTEWYKQIYDIGASEISNFTVSMDGTPLTYKSWNIHESLSSKAGYYGINYTTNGAELCFGKTDYNRHTFTLKYKISNMILNVDDAQVFYWTVIPKSSGITFDKFNLTIKP